jgi:hypothetical protein
MNVNRPFGNGIRSHFLDRHVSPHLRVSPGVRTVAASFVALIGVALLTASPRPVTAVLAFGFVLNLISIAVAPTLPRESIPYKVLSAACTVGYISLIAAMGFLFFMDKL